MFPTHGQWWSNRGTHLSTASAGECLERSGRTIMQVWQSRRCPPSDHSFVPRSHISSTATRYSAR